MSLLQPQGGFPLVPPPLHFFCLQCSMVGERVPGRTITENAESSGLKGPGVHRKSQALCSNPHSCPALLGMSTAIPQCSTGCPHRALPNPSTQPAALPAPPLNAPTSPAPASPRQSRCEQPCWLCTYSLRSWLLPGKPACPPVLQLPPALSLLRFSFWAKAVLNTPWDPRRRQAGSHRPHTALPLRPALPAGIPADASQQHPEKVTLRSPIPPLALCPAGRTV